MRSGPTKKMPKKCAKNALENAHFPTGPNFAAPKPGVGASIFDKGSVFGISKKMLIMDIFWFSIFDKKKFFSKNFGPHKSCAPQKFFLPAAARPRKKNAQLSQKSKKMRKKMRKNVHFADRRFAPMKVGG